MKLIIDIDENDYNDITEQVKNNDYPDMHMGNAIANGIPYDEPENVIMTKEEYAKFKDEMQKANRQLYTVTSNTFVEGASITTEVKGDLISREALKNTQFGQK